MLSFLGYSGAAFAISFAFGLFAGAFMRVGMGDNETPGMV